MERFTFCVEEDMEEERVDKCLLSLLAPLSRTYIQKLIREGEVLSNGFPVKANYRVKVGDVLQVCVPQPQKPDVLPEDIPLDILYEDGDVLVVDKPKGMVVHPAPGHYTGTLVNALLYHCGESLSGIGGFLRPGIVHRIDKDTTGSLLVCKNDFAHASIAAQLKEHTIHRRYVAITCGILSQDEGVVASPIGRHPTDRKKMAVNYKNGKDALTRYRVLQRFDRYTYIECALETGRTHQIRVHMASIGHPLLGDMVYGPGQRQNFSLEGQTLHARTLGFIHPRSGVYVETSAPLPAYFSRLLDIL